jgi:hypothetical protein
MFTGCLFHYTCIQDNTISGIVGRDEENRRFIDFNVFGQKRKRFYLITEPNVEAGEQSRIDFAPTKRCR